jgi:hypothetical protein
VSAAELHPDDVLFFAEVATAMKAVAIRYGLPLRTITHLPPDYLGFDTDRWGDCDEEGNIRLMLRAKVGGRWTAGPMSPQQVWKTAAHELAHLKYYDHGEPHEELMKEMEDALANQREDHREKVLRKLVKIKAQQESEARMGNLEAADCFARMINKMLLENELRPSDIDYARTNLDDPVIEVRADLLRYGMPIRKMRSAWQESLARVVAKAHLCSFLIIPKSNVIVFVGTKSHATVAEYAYGVLVAAAEKIADQEWVAHYRLCEKTGNKGAARGFRQSWLRAFVRRIGERFDAELKSALFMIADPDSTGTSTALMRLDGAMIKVQEYIDNKFRGVKKRAADALNGYREHNVAGQAWGYAAADRMSLGRKGIEPPQIMGLLEAPVIYILAANTSIAESYCQENDIPLEKVVFLNEPQELFGLEAPTVLLHQTFHERRDAEQWSDTLRSRRAVIKEVR